MRQTLITPKLESPLFTSWCQITWFLSSIIKTQMVWLAAETLIITSTQVTKYIDVKFDWV